MVLLASYEDGLAVSVVRGGVQTRRPPGDQGAAIVVLLVYYLVALAVIRVLVLAARICRRCACSAGDSRASWLEKYRHALSGPAARLVAPPPPPPPALLVMHGA